MVELGVQPIVKRMAGGAVGSRERSPSRRMHRIRRLLPIRQVAGRAGSRKPNVISDRGVFMAILAFHHGVRAEQWKPVEVLLHRLDRNPPAENRVALGAAGAELGAVNVCVTIGAIFSNVGENRPGMTSRAGYFLVHAAKRVPRGVVVKFGYGSDRGPACVRMAIFAGNGEGTMRASARLPLGESGHDNG